MHKFKYQYYIIIMYVYIIMYYNICKHTNIYIDAKDPKKPHAISTFLLILKLIV